ncbi:MAG: hypothetical protein HY700_13815 [Gemmatimonadetes bacterium]|nr:hypothetical protein [Gemmatimonadota bacterium]
MKRRISFVSMAIAAALLGGAGRVAAQAVPTDVIPGVKTGGSRNIKVLSHLPLDSIEKTADITIEQELSRPYVYTAHRLTPSGVDIISIKDPTKPQLLWSWRIENAQLHRGAGSLNPMYLKSKGRYYLTNAFQFQQGGPDVDLCAVVWDVTGLPDTSKIKELARIRIPQAPGGCHESYSYKHSNGQALLLTSTMSAYANIYDIDQVVANGQNGHAGLVGQVPIPDTANGGSVRAYHDFYVAYDEANHRDVFYGAGVGGYFIYDVTDLKNPKLLTSITGVAGVQRGHTFMVEPTGRYGWTETEYQYAPLRVFDLKPGLDGTVKTISRPIGAWTADWKDLSHNFEIRWPYVFVSAYEDGLQVVNMMDPANPYTVGYYYTCDCPHMMGKIGGQGSVMNGAWGVQVRNADGLIVISDLMTGFWAFKMEGFDGWNGHQWGVPNVSSAQDWDNGPVPPRKPVS